MGEPCQGMTADAAIALRNVRPVGVLSQPEKNTRGALVWAMGQHDFVTFAEYRTSRSSAHMFVYLLLFNISFAAPGYGRKFSLFTSLAFSNLVFAASSSLAIRAASLCGAS
jgi:hypothetical protein